MLIAEGGRIRHKSVVLFQNNSLNFLFPGERRGKEVYNACCTLYTVYTNSVASSGKISQPTEQSSSTTLIKRTENLPQIQGNSERSSRKALHEEGPPTHEETQKYFPIYEEAVSHTWLRNRSTPNPPPPPPTHTRGKPDSPLHQCKRNKTGHF